jgi:hypothetical protein
MLFTGNSLATHNSHTFEQRMESYRKMTDTLFNAIGNENIERRCESCGNSHSIDRQLGRDLFPLVGRQRCSNIT